MSLDGSPLCRGLPCVLHDSDQQDASRSPKASRMSFSFFPSSISPSSKVFVSAARGCWPGRALATQESYPQFVEASTRQRACVHTREQAQARAFRITFFKKYLNGSTMSCNRWYLRIHRLVACACTHLCICTAMHLCLRTSPHQALNMLALQALKLCFFAMASS